MKKYNIIYTRGYNKRAAADQKFACPFKTGHDGGPVL
jgi:hypothetical protein